MITDHSLQKDVIKIFLENNNCMFDIPLSVQASAYLEEYGIKEDVVKWKKVFKIVNEYFKSKPDKEEA